MNFKELLYRARQGDEEAILEIYEMYRPLLIKNALVDGIFDEDLYQELTAELLKCIRYFRDVEQDYSSIGRGVTGKVRLFRILQRTE